ncbi:helix-turn-helix transcriptional regulator [Paraburkholderia sartisoli]|uniref:helix-turn-helix transcriptional regulator n=1 Tax=Paraburkholderia sartisoli TaxID=83784 RepID=UPI001160C33C|nr:helix-turn-helix transcriptional regulator [Paraburkholderia sartisoli]
MELDEEQYDQLVHRIYDTVTDSETWHLFYAELAELIVAKTIRLIGFDKKHNALSFSDGFNLLPGRELGYIRRYHQIDPRLSMLWSQPVLKWLHCHEHFDAEFVRNNRFFQEFLLPGGRRYASCVKLVDDETVTVFFACLRTVDQGPFALDAVAILERLTPHLARAARFQIQRFVFSTDALVGHALVNRWRQPVILASTEGDVLRLNGAAERLLQTTMMVRTNNRKVTLPAPFQQRFLEDCATTEAHLRVASADVHADAARYRVMRIQDSTSPFPQDTLYAFYNLIAPGEVSAVFGLRAIVMLIFYHPPSAPPVDEDLLAAAFDLTPAECRVAHFLAGGMSPKEIATRIGVQHDTVRKQLQAIYQKTATNRQPDLVRLLLHLPGNGGGQ